MDLKTQILELGFTESYKLWDPDGERQEGEAYVKNGITLCVRSQEATMFNRWTGKFLFVKQDVNNLINKIKTQLKQWN